MAISNPSITIPLTAHQYELLQIISSSSGQSMSGTVTSLLSGAEPTLEHMANSFQKLKTIADDQRERFSSSLARAHAEIQPLAEASLLQFNDFLDTLNDIGDGKLSDVNAVDSVPRTNRGATTTPSKPLKPKRNKA